MSGRMYPEVGEQIDTPQGPGVIQDIVGSIALVMLESGNMANVQLDDLEMDPFIQFVCDDCKFELQLYEPIYPGQAAVIVCESCGMSWTVFAPPAQKYRTEKFETIWPVIAQ